MGQGQGSVIVNQKRQPQAPPGPPFLLTSADNGLSVDPISGKIVLGQSVGAAGDPAQLLNRRDIPTENFELHLLGLIQTNEIVFAAQNPNVIVQNGTDGGELDINQATFTTLLFGRATLESRGTTNWPRLTLQDAIVDFELFTSGTGQLGIESTGAFPGALWLLIDPVNNLYQFGDINNAHNRQKLSINDLTKVSFLGGDPAGSGFFIQVDNTNNTFTYQDGGNNFLFLDVLNAQYRIGDIDGAAGGTTLDVNDGAGEFRLFNNALTSKVRINNVIGFTGTVTPVTTITVDGGIVTNVA